MLKSSKIFLRAVEPADLDCLLAWENNPEYWRVSNTLTPFSKELIHQYVHSAQDIYAVRQIRLMIEETASGKTVGAIDLFDFEPRHQRAGVGILIDEKYRKKGYASDALKLVKEYALNVVGIRNLFAVILADNKASIALFEKSGFEKVGHRKNWFNDGKNWIDEFMYQSQLIN
ncbi:MAG: GNAT family N-acetyltransferase [Bacteroidetes bacterium]|nr:GNAT family N-acetyltransferase [Bacteroidota bacterium]